MIDASGLDRSTALVLLRHTEDQLGATRGKVDRVAERAQLRAQSEALASRLRELREAEKLVRRLRRRAGFGSALHDAVRARFDPPTLAELEIEALAQATEQERQREEAKLAAARAFSEAAP